MFEGSQYDVVAEHDGRFIKIQVKGTGSPKNKIGGAGHITPTYKFTVRDISIRNVDIIAFVAMDIEKILYVDASKSTGISKSKWVSIGRMMTPDETAIIKYFGASSVQSQIPLV